MLTKDDIRGVSAMIPTPCKEGQGGWQYENSVDLDETAAYEKLGAFYLGRVRDFDEIAVIDESEQRLELVIAVSAPPSSRLMPSQSQPSASTSRNQGPRNPASVITMGRHLDGTRRDNCCRKAWCARGVLCAFSGYTSS